MRSMLVPTRPAFLEPDTIRRFVLPTVCIVSVAVFVALPGDISQKTHQALHGLCAQRPSHSYWLGSERLPFDARMTGIYGSGSIALLILTMRGRLFAFARPSWPMIALLVAFVGVMAVDGLNSTLLDLGRWHPYEPRNELRLLTGALTGLSLAATLGFLAGATFWRTGRRDLAIVSGPGELGMLLVVAVGFCGIIMVAPVWLFATIAIFLLVSAVCVVAMLALIMLTIAIRRDGTYRRLRDLDLTASIAIVLAVLVMVGIASGRFWLERTFGVPPLA